MLEFIRQYDEKVDSGEVGAKPIVCAQDLPERVAVDAGSISSNRVTFPARTSSGSSMRVTLHVVDGAWRISDVECKTPMTPRKRLGVCQITGLAEGK